MYVQAVTHQELMKGEAMEGTGVVSLQWNDPPSFLQGFDHFIVTIQLARCSKFANTKAYVVVLQVTNISMRQTRAVMYNMIANTALIILLAICHLTLFFRLVHAERSICLHQIYQLPQSKISKLTIHVLLTTMVHGEIALPPFQNKWFGFA